jgi:hypothetical protein
MCIVHVRRGLNIKKQKTKKSNNNDNNDNKKQQSKAVDLEFQNFVSVKK